MNGNYYIANTNFSVRCVTAPCSDSSCAIGQYISSSLCTGTFCWTCASCTNANSTQIYSSKGGFSGNCQVASCPMDCAAGYYTAGYGTASTSCVQCTNTVANSKYYLNCSCQELAVPGRMYI